MTDPATPDEAYTFYEPGSPAAKAELDAQAPEFRSGFVAFVGRPNVGKSTLLNALIGSKIAIVSDKPQTTRHRLRGIVETDHAQIVIVDTPGLHKPQDALGEELNRSALLALSDVDVACLFIDASMPVGRGDAWVAAHVAKGPQRVLVITKADLVDQATVIKQLEAARKLCAFDDEIVVSSLAAFNLDGMVATLEHLLPVGPAYFPPGTTTDQQLETRLAEFIREKVLTRTREEVPHSVGVVIEELSYDRKKDVTAIMATIFVEHDSQRGIVVGAAGEMIKAIGTEARADIEELLKTRVYLDLRVKVRKDWRRDASQIRRFGYGEGL